MGSDFYETPHLDQLAGEGMIFTNAYSASANCAARRPYCLDNTAHDIRFTMSVRHGGANHNLAN